MVGSVLHVPLRRGRAPARGGIDAFARRIAVLVGGAALMLALLLLVMTARLVHASRGSIALRDVLHGWLPALF